MYNGSSEDEKYHNVEDAYEEQYGRFRYMRICSVRDDQKKFRNAPILVWWDIEGCPAPRHPCETSDEIVKALRNMDYDGTVTIFLYGRVPCTQVQDALRGKGIVLDYATEMSDDEGDNAIDMDTIKVEDRMVTNMLCFTLATPAPANCLLITHDPNLPNITPFLAVLKRRGYNIFTAQVKELEEYSDMQTWIWRWPALAVGGSPITEEEMENMRKSETWRSFPIE